MAFKKRETIVKEGNSRRFDAIADMQDADFWNFQYITLNNETHTDQTIDGGTVDDSGLTVKQGGYYPDPRNSWPVGTIFFESTPQVLYMTSSIAEVIIDTEPPEFVGEDVQYLVFDTNRVCKFIIDSDTLLDVCQLKISCGDDILYQCSRKDGINSLTFIDEDNNEQNYITKISCNKNVNQYTLTFTLDKNYSVEALNENQLKIEVWDIAANKAEYTTEKFWHDLDNDPNTLKPLIIEFIDVEPEDKLISKNIEGKVLVKITNPNDSLWKILPTFDLFNNSIGIIDESSITCYNGDPEKSKPVSPTDPETDKVITLFYITNINKKGYIHVEAWIDVDNSDIKELIKNQTYADASLGPFIFADDGRKYKFNSYTPNYLTDDLYKKFVKFSQDFLNTSQTSLSTGNYISTLEKIARINNFMDPFRVEAPLLNEYVKEFNIEVNPNLNEYIYYLNHQKGLTKDK